jgi:hypothetical protein
MAISHAQGSWLRTFCYLVAGILVLLSLPALWQAWDGFRSAVMAGWCLILMGILWSQKRKIHLRVFPWVNGAFVFGGVVLIYNAGQIHRARNIWQFMTLADHTPWTPGHTLGLMLGAAAGLAVIKLGKPSPMMNSEEILSGPRLVTMAEAQSKVPLSGKPDEKMLFWGGLNLPERCGTEHFAIVGTPGSGKSLSISLLMKSVIPSMTKSSGRRALIYDAKRDTAALLPSLLEGIEPPPVTHFMNPFDLRSSPWEMNQDIREGATALQIAGIFIPEMGGESQPFFRNAARILLAGVMEAFTRLAPDDWTLRDVILALRFKERIVAILASHPETASLIPKYVSGKSRDDDVATTLDTFLRPFSFVAAAWHHSDQPSVSLEQWARSEELLILGSDPKFDSILQPLNRAIFKRAVELVRRQPDVRKGESRQSWFFIDELRNAGALEDIDKLLVEGRSKGACVVIGFQDLAGLREVFGDKRADEIIGACANKVFLQNGEGTTIEYATKHFKSQEVLETKVSRSSGWSASSNSVSQQKTMKPVVHEGLLKSLPKPEMGRVGLNGYCDTAAVGTLSPYLMELSPQFLTDNLPRANEAVEGFLARPSAHLELPEWTREDLKRLGLEVFSNLASDEQIVKNHFNAESSGTEAQNDTDPDIFQIG